MSASSFLQRISSRSRHKARRTKAPSPASAAPSPTDPRLPPTPSPGFLTPLHHLERLPPRNFTSADQAARFGANRPRASRDTHKAGSGYALRFGHRLERALRRLEDECVAAERRADELPMLALPDVETLFWHVVVPTIEPDACGMVRNNAGGGDAAWKETWAAAERMRGRDEAEAEYLYGAGPRNEDADGNAIARLPGLRRRARLGEVCSLIDRVLRRVGWRLAAV